VRIRVGLLGAETLDGLAPWASNIHLADGLITLSTQSNDALPEILRYLINAQVDVYEFTPQRLSLEESFLKIMGEDPGS
jgi:predicted component of type VI protein secretion system